MDQPLIVQAEYSFKGGNNDELCFKKGDLITVTQREEGGWWEGTLNDKTGWFPSNYVNEYKAPLPISEIIRPPEEIQEYRSVVLKDLLDSERAHVAEIQGLLENFLEPLQASQILTVDEYAQLMCNFVEVVKTHDELLSNIEDCNDRVGKLFLTKAPLIKQIHQAYCAAHPRAIVILDKYKDELEKYMERQGASSPGLLVLTTGLSKPFRRLDKYSAMLQELERHMESSHPDRGDTQRSVAVYKDIAATCSATRRQKELELQVLTGPVRGWQGQELSSLGDIIHMGSVAVGPDHRDRYFVLFPQTLLILSVSQRMSAFIYEGKLPLAGIVVNRLEDTEDFKNAFEISGTLIERIVAVCQGPNEAKKWVELLTSSKHSLPIGIKRQLSSSSMSAPQPPPHMSPPASLGAMSHSNPRTTSSIHQQSQHKRSLSFNHHLSYNQYHTPHQAHHLHQLPQQNQQNHLVVSSRKSNLVPISNNISKITTTNMATVASMGTNQGQSGRIVNTKANWSITNLRPAPPLRPSLLNQSTTGNSGGSSNTLSSYCSGRKNQPNFEEDALVLRVIEAYCAAYQNNARNTIHSALQPWTPCLPIRGGKLKTSKPFSTSNPHLPFLCSSPFSSGNSGGGGGAASVFGYTSAQNQQRQNSVNSLNSSYIWREANPNNFNMYSTSVSSLNTAYRYSLTGGAGGPSNIGNHYIPSTIECRALSEERATRKSLNRFKTGSGGFGSEHLSMTPLLPRRNKQAKIVKNSYQIHQRTPPPLLRNHSEESPDRCSLSSGLYDRRLNRSFETASKAFQDSSTTNLKTTKLRRSTPHLAEDDYNNPDAGRYVYGCASGGGGASVIGGGLENEDMTPTLRQLWTAIKQMQQDMSQIKVQINEERALRGGLQQLLMSHLESSNGSGSNSKC